MYATMLACNNFFERTSEFGEYTISDNALEVRGSYKAGQYVRIMDSFLNDGVYKISSIADTTLTLDGTLADETFTGYIVGLAVPPEFITLAAKVEAFAARGISSESIPNYSVSYNAKSGAEAYASDLATYKKFPRGRYYFLNSEITGVQIYTED